METGNCCSGTHEPVLFYDLARIQIPRGTFEWYFTTRGGILANALLRRLLRLLGKLWMISRIRLFHGLLVMLLLLPLFRGTFRPQPADIDKVERVETVALFVAAALLTTTKITASCRRGSLATTPWWRRRRVVVFALLLDDGPKIVELHGSGCFFLLVASLSFAGSISLSN